MKSLLIREIAWEMFWHKLSGYGEVRMKWFDIWRSITWEDMFGKESW